MALGLNLTTNEVLQAGSGIGQNTGTAFVVGRTDLGPIGTAVPCQSLADYTNTFGPFSSTSVNAYNWVDTFFREGGALLYFTRDTDATATTPTTATVASLTLQDAGAKPSVVVTTRTPGVGGNSIQVIATRVPQPTFTASTTSSSSTIGSVSSFVGLGTGTPISGTGIPTGTYIVSTNPGAGTAVITNNATATTASATLTPAALTVTITDQAGNVLSIHGPYTTTAPLIADNGSSYVAFSQSAATGFTTNLPVASPSAPLTGGANANLNSLTTSTASASLSAFPKALGPGTVASSINPPDATLWAGLEAHAASNNRWAAKDLADSPSAAQLITSIGAAGTSTTASYGAFFTSRCTIPGFTPTVPRQVNASAAVAALRARVASTGNDNQAPAGVDWPLVFVTGFTNTYNETDTVTLNSAGINTFQTPTSGLGLPALCLCGFSSPVSPLTDPIYWQASAALERMALVAQASAILKSYFFKTLDGQNSTLTAAQHDLQILLAQHWGAGALFGDTATDAGTVNVQAPINTTATEQQGQLNANLEVRISPFVQAENLSISAFPITQSV